jgi:hypothetical protein
MRRVVPIGFDGCQFSRFNGDPQISTSNKPYSAEAFKNLNVLFKGSESIPTGWRVNVDIENNGDVPISANSSTGNPISLSYRLLDQAGKPMSNWDPRIPLWVDIPAHGIEYIEFDIPKSTPAFVFIELSLVQEGIFWGYDIGKAPKRVLLTNTRGGKFGH